MCVLTHSLSFFLCPSISLCFSVFTDKQKDSVKREGMEIIRTKEKNI